MPDVSIMWLPGGHLQTIVPALVGRHLIQASFWRRERIETPDGDFLDWDWLVADAEIRSNAPLWVLFHGLEGSSGSHYAAALAWQAKAHGCGLVVIHFRGCSGHINRLPRAYHSGDHHEIDWVLRAIKREHPLHPLVAVGISLGGNALLCWAGVQQAAAEQVVGAVLAVSPPLDLTVSGEALGQGWNKMLYTPMFLRTMKQKARDKWAQYPHLFDLHRANAASTLREFDDAFTAPLHGFGSVERYWKEASALPHLCDIQVPTCVINARNDPFVPAACLPVQHQVSRSVSLVQPPTGGHVGFWKLAGADLCQGACSGNQSLPMFLFDWVGQQGGIIAEQEPSNG